MANKQQKRLGKGLSALLGDYATEERPVEAEGTEGAEGVRAVPTSALRPNPFQPRRQLAREKLDELIESIRENGLLQPLVVRPAADDGWEIVAGERRWRAVSELGWAQVPAIVRDIDDRTMLVLALVENLQREELTALEEARAYRRLLDQFGLTQAEVAETVGRDRSTVANTVRLLALPDPVKEMLADGRLTAGHGRALLGLADTEEAIRLAEEVARKGLSVRETERRVRARTGGADSSGGRRRTGPDPDPYAREAQRRLARALGTDVRIRLKGKTSGRIEIPFRDAQDFERILEAVLGTGAVQELGG